MIYFQSLPLKTKQFSDHRLSMEIAKKMAEIHNLDIPISKQPKRVWHKMNIWFSNSQTLMKNSENNEKYQDQIEKIKEFDVAEEMDWLKDIIQEGNFPIVFCHNDMNEGNILLKTKEDSEEDSISADPELVIIDFEFSSYNYRGFDLANHFLEWIFDYTNISYPFFYHFKENYPTVEQSHDFIRTYLKKLHKLEDGSDYLVSNAEIEGIEKEIKVFSMLSHLFWALWSISNSHQNIEFGYWDYALTRINCYKEEKELFLEEKEN